MKFGGKQDVHGSSSGVQAVVKQAGQRRPLAVLTVLGGGELAGVVTEQVMHRVPARPGGMNQVHAGQQFQHVTALTGGAAGECGDRIRLQVRAWVQAGQPECAGGAGVQLSARPGQHRAHCGPRVGARLSSSNTPLKTIQVPDGRTFGQDRLDISTRARWLRHKEEP